MALSSIFHNVIIKDRKTAEALVDAMEKAEAFANEHPLGEVKDDEVMKPDEIKAFFSGRSPANVNKNDQQEDLS